MNGIAETAIEAGLLLSEPRWKFGGYVADLTLDGELVTSGDERHLRSFLDGYTRGHKAGRIAEMRRSREAKRK